MIDFIFGFLLFLASLYTFFLLKRTQKVVLASKNWFWPANGVRSTRSLVEIHNTYPMSNVQWERTILKDRAVVHVHHVRHVLQWQDILKLVYQLQSNKLCRFERKLFCVSVQNGQAFVRLISKTGLKMSWPLDLRFRSEKLINVTPK